MQWQRVYSRLAATYLRATPHAHELTATSILLVCVAMQATPLVYAYLNGFVSWGST